MGKHVNEAVRRSFPDITGTISSSRLRKSVVLGHRSNPGAAVSSEDLAAQMTHAVNTPNKHYYLDDAMKRKINAGIYLDELTKRQYSDEHDAETNDESDDGQQPCTSSKMQKPHSSSEKNVENVSKKKSPKKQSPIKKKKIYNPKRLCKPVHKVVRGKAYQPKNIFSKEETSMIISATKELPDKAGMEEVVKAIRRDKTCKANCLSPASGKFTKLQLKDKFKTIRRRNRKKR